MCQGDLSGQRPHPSCDGLGTLSAAGGGEGLSKLRLELRFIQTHRAIELWTSKQLCLSSNQIIKVMSGGKMSGYVGTPSPQPHYTHLPHIELTRDG